MINDFVSALHRKIKEEVNLKTDQIAGGSCRNYEDYQKLCGEIRGLLLAGEHLTDLAKKVSQDDE